MIKFKKIMSVMCAASVAASMAVMPAFAETASAYNYEVKYTDDCSAKSSFITAAYDETALNSNGFIWHTDMSGWGDHLLYLDFGLKGNFELYFDYFANDIDKALDDVVMNGEKTYKQKKDEDGNLVTDEDGNPVMEVDKNWSGGTFIRANSKTDPGYNYAPNTGTALSWFKTLKTDNDEAEALKIGTYARASRKYGVPAKDEEAAPVIGENDPTYVNVKIVQEDGKLNYYAKWNTEQNWISICKDYTVEKYDPTKDMRFYIQGMPYDSIDNVVVKTPAWGTLVTDECNSLTYIENGSDGSLNKTFGFAYFNPNSIGADHSFKLNYGVAGNFEMTFDYFMNDIDINMTGKQGLGDFRTQILQKHASKVTTPKYTAMYVNKGWNVNLAKDDGTELNLGDYAKASRKYGTASYGEENAPSVDEFPTFANMKILVEDGYVTTFMKWNTELNWIQLEKTQLDTSYNSALTTMYSMIGRWGIAVDNVVVKAPVYDDSLLPGVNPNSMKSVKPSISWVKSNYTDSTDSYYEGRQGTFNNVITDDFVLSYTFRPYAINYSQKQQLFFGVNKENVTNSFGSQKGYVGRIGIGDYGNEISAIRGYFADEKLNEPFVTWGRVLGEITGEKKYISTDMSYNIMISFVNNNLKYAIKKADGIDNWHWFTTDYKGEAEIGSLVLMQNGLSGEYTNMKLWIPEKEMATRPVVAQGEDGAITTSAKIADYTGSAEYVQPKLLTALYKTNADGSKKLCGVNVSEDSTQTSTVKTLTGSLTAPTAEGSYEVKAMLWDSLNGLSPLTKATTDTITVAAATEAE